MGETGEGVVMVMSRGCEGEAGMGLHTLSVFHELLRVLDPRVDHCTGPIQPLNLGKDSHTYIKQNNLRICGFDKYKYYSLKSVVSIVE